MPDGPVNAGTRAVDPVTDAARIGPITFSPQLLHAGKNVLSAELHLRTETSSDVVFGAEVSLASLVAPPAPGKPFREQDELEWIELYNRSAQTVDLSGWSLQDAVDYEFAPGTSLAPGQFLVVAANRLALAEKHPDVAARILGDYARDLSDGSDRLVLSDARQNPVDSVQYADGLGWPSAADGGGASLELRNAAADNSRRYVGGKPSEQRRPVADVQLSGGRQQSRGTGGARLLRRVHSGITRLRRSAA